MAKSSAYFPTDVEESSRVKENIKNHMNHTQFDMRPSRPSGISFPFNHDVLWNREPVSYPRFLRAVDAIPALYLISNEINMLLSMLANPSYTKVDLTATILPFNKISAVDRRIVGSLFLDKPSYILCLSDRRADQQRRHLGLVISHGDNCLTVPISKATNMPLEFGEDSTVNLVRNLGRSICSGRNFSLKSCIRVRGLGFASQSSSPSSAERGGSPGGESTTTTQTTTAETGPCHGKELLCGTLRLEAIMPNISLQAVQVRPVPVLTTPLSRQLCTGIPSNLPPSMGYLTLNQTRKVVMLLEDDSSVPMVPLVGVWVKFHNSEMWNNVESHQPHGYDSAGYGGGGGGDLLQPQQLEPAIASSPLNHPYCWAACVRFLNSDAVQQRILAADETFLMMLLVGEQVEYFEITRIPETLMGDAKYLCTDFTVDLSVRNNTAGPQQGYSSGLERSDLQHVPLSSSSPSPSPAAAAVGESESVLCRFRPLARPELIQSFRRALLRTGDCEPAPSATMAVSPSSARPVYQALENLQRVQQTNSQHNPENYTAHHLEDAAIHDTLRHQVSSRDYSNEQSLNEPDLALSTTDSASGDCDRGSDRDRSGSPDDLEVSVPAPRPPCHPPMQPPVSPLKGDVDQAQSSRSRSRADFVRGESATAGKAAPAPLCFEPAQSAHQLQQQQQQQQQQSLRWSTQSAPGCFSSLMAASKIERSGGSLSNYGWKSSSIRAAVEQGSGTGYRSAGQSLAEQQGVPQAGQVGLSYPAEIIAAQQMQLEMLRNQVEELRHMVSLLGGQHMINLGAHRMLESQILSETRPMSTGTALYSATPYGTSQPGAPFRQIPSESNPGAASYSNDPLLRGNIVGGREQVRLSKPYEYPDQAQTVLSQSSEERSSRCGPDSSVSASVCTKHPEDKSVSSTLAACATPAPPNTQPPCSTSLSNTSAAAADARSPGPYTNSESSRKPEVHFSAQDRHESMDAVLLSTSLDSSRLTNSIVEDPSLNMKDVHRKALNPLDAFIPKLPRVRITSTAAAAAAEQKEEQEEQEQEEPSVLFSEDAHTRSDDDDDDDDDDNDDNDDNDDDDDDDGNSAVAGRSSAVARSRDNVVEGGGLLRESTDDIDEAESGDHFSGSINSSSSGRFSRQDREQVQAWTQQWRGAGVGVGKGAGIAIPRAAYRVPALPSAVPKGARIRATEEAHSILESDSILAIEARYL